MEKPEPSFLAILCAILATALWGGTFLGPEAVAPIGPVLLVLGRYFVFGTICLIVLTLRWRKVKRVATREIVLALHLGAIGYVGFYLFFSLSATMGGGVVASIVTGAMPAFVTVGSNLVRKEVPWRILASPLMVTTAGILIINAFNIEDVAVAGSYDLLHATVFALGACVLWAYFVIVNGRALAASHVDNITWTCMIGLGAMVSSVLLVPVAFSEIEHQVSANALPWVRYAMVTVLLATLGSWCASWAWTVASKRLSTVFLGQLIALETVFGTVFNLIWVQRWPSVAEIVGACAVVLGVVICVRVFERSRLG